MSKLPKLPKNPTAPMRYASMEISFAHWPDEPKGKRVMAYWDVGHWGPRGYGDNEKQAMAMLLRENPR